MRREVQLPRVGAGGSQVPRPRREERVEGSDVVVEEGVGVGGSQGVLVLPEHVQVDLPLLRGPHHNVSVSELLAVFQGRSASIGGGGAWNFIVSPSIVC